jgi:glycosyltransferase involved in cell wall biosynthesis
VRVALVLGTSTGGVGRHVADLVGGLVGSGADVVVACPPEVEARFRFGEGGAHVVPLEVSDRPNPLADARATARLRELAKVSDVLHAHGLRAAALAVLATARTATPVVATLHNAAPAGAVTARVHAALERVVARGAELVLVVSADLAERMRRLGAAEVDLAVVAAPVPGPPTKDRHAVRAALGAEGATPLVVTVARLAPQKDLGLLLDAVGLLVARGEGELLAVVAGDGPERAALQARVDAERLPVRLLGGRHDVPDLLAAADAVVSTARWEGQPVALQEALHAGAAVVATDAGGTGAVVGNAALLVPVGDAEALAAALHDVLAHGSVRDDLRSRAVERAATLPSSADALGAALAAYRRVGVTGARGRP